MKQKFIDRKFSKTNMKKIEQVSEIVEEYQKQYLSLTLRQLYYQMVSRGYIPNKQTEYQKLSDLVSNGRRAGLIDWSAIEDRTRGLVGYMHYDDPAAAIKEAAYGYRIDLLEDQPVYLECWVEKDALKDLVGIACTKYNVRYFSCRGFTSDTEIYKAGRRMRWEIEQGKDVVILHLGDHDPSGIDMSRDILERIELFGEIPNKIDFRRIALNMDQIQKYNPPPNPAKETDTRFKTYQKLYGDTSWELDALEPSIFMDLIKNQIEGVIDMKKFKERKRLEEEQRKQMIEIAENWQNQIAN